MTKQVFLNRLANGKIDVLQQFLNLLQDMRIDYCVIGGLAVNAYVEPVVSLDLDLVIAADNLNELSKAAKKVFTLKKFAHSLNLKSAHSDLRIQLQTDPRYQAFVGRGVDKKVLGYRMKVANVEDVLQGKIWAFSDERRRKSKRQKDLADIFRLVEARPRLKKLLPESIRAMM